MIDGIIRYMRAFFLFLAVAILYAHMIIPHDHHPSDSGLCQENKYPVSKDGRTHHPAFPFHCHAFYDLASEKAIVYNLIKHVKYLDFTPGSVLIPAVANLQISYGRICYFYVLPVNSGILELSSLRAPPQLG
jgi:hypothetical protein